jgi:hypothetical protein
MNISDFLVWLTGAGCLIAASWILGQFIWYTSLIEKARQWIFFGLAAVFGCGSYAVIIYVPASTLNAIAPYFGIVAFVFIAIFVNKTYTKISNALKMLEDLKN